MGGSHKRVNLPFGVPSTSARFMVAVLSLGNTWNILSYVWYTSFSAYGVKTAQKSENHGQLNSLPILVKFATMPSPM